MHKAHDHAEWVFLEGILLKMGFQASWVKLIMMCALQSNREFDLTQTKNRALS